VPPKVEYALTEIGRSFLEPMGTLVEWAMANHAAIRASRAAYVPPAAA
jgi:DNA-binding HxlR family transcriptional regulator